MTLRSAPRWVLAGFAVLATAALLVPSASADSPSGGRAPVFDLPAAGFDLSNQETQSAFANLTQAFNQESVRLLPLSGDLERADNGIAKVSYQNQTGRHQFWVPVKSRPDVGLSVVPQDIEPYGMMYFHQAPRSFAEVHIVLNPTTSQSNGSSRDPVDQARHFLDRLGVDQSQSRIEIQSTGEGHSAFISEIYYPTQAQADQPGQPSVSLTCSNCTDVEVTTPGINVNEARFVFDEGSRLVFFEATPWIDIEATDSLSIDQLTERAEQRLEEEGIRDRSGGGGSWVWLPEDFDREGAPLFQFVYRIDSGVDEEGETVAAVLGLNPWTGNVTGFEKTLIQKQTDGERSTSSGGPLFVLVCLGAASGVVRLRSGDRG